MKKFLSILDATGNIQVNFKIAVSFLNNSTALPVLKSVEATLVNDICMKTRRLRKVHL